MTYQVGSAPAHSRGLLKLGKGHGKVGWLIGIHLDLQKSKTELAVLDAYDLAAGPLAMVTLPYELPPGLHGNFVHAT